MLGNYQIALIVLLLLNFVFWLLIICWRVFLNKSTFRQPQIPGSRLRRTGFDNPIVVTGDETDLTINDPPPYSNVVTSTATVELPPPSYEDVVKSIDPVPPYTPDINTRSQNRPEAVANISTFSREYSRVRRRISEEDQQLVFHDGKGNVVNIYTIPVEAPCYLLLDSERVLRANQEDA